MRTLPPIPLGEWWMWHFRILKLIKVYLRANHMRVFSVRIAIKRDRPYSPIHRTSSGMTMTLRQRLAIVWVLTRWMSPCFPVHPHLHSRCAPSLWPTLESKRKERAVHRIRS